MSPLAGTPLAFLDLEMTGLDPKIDRVVEICVERVTDGILQGRLESLVCPGEHLVGGGSFVHGLGALTLSTAPSFAELTPRAMALLDGAIVVAHAVAWDLTFLEKELGLAGVAFTRPRAIDTLQLSRRCFSLASHSLDSLGVHLGLGPRRAHRAGDDVRALRALFDRCVEILRPASVEDLLEVRVAERHARPQVMAACEEAVRTGEPVLVTFRRSGKPLETMRMVLSAMDVGREPPHVVGYELPGRGRRELRCDRILRCEPFILDPPRRLG